MEATGRGAPSTEQLPWQEEASQLSCQEAVGSSKNLQDRQRAPMRDARVYGPAGCVSYVYGLIHARHTTDRPRCLANG